MRSSHPYCFVFQILHLHMSHSWLNHMFIEKDSNEEKAQSSYKWLSTLPFK